MFLKIKLLLLARMGDIFITVGDLFACGKASIVETPPVVSVLISIYRKLRSFLACIRL